MWWFLSGAFGHASDADAVAQLAGLSDRWRGVNLWAEGCDLSLRLWAQRFVQRVAQIDAEPWLMGYSLGGRLALHALLAAPSLWRGAVILSAHPGLATPQERAQRKASDAEWLRRLESEPWADFWAAWNDQPTLSPSKPRPLPEFRVGMRRALSVWSLSQQADLRGPLGDIPSPVLWLTGARDQKFTQVAVETQPLIPWARHMVIPAVGHRLLTDAPAAVAAVLAAYRAEWDA